MARLERYHLPGSFYHVMLRGNDGQDIFFSDVDRCAMCLLLQEGVEKYGHRIHAFCFMNNHIHLLIQVGEIALSKIIQNLAFRYSQKVNRKNKRIGHLFQGRFKAILIEENNYFTRLLRYIHMNPVRANIVATPEIYGWSSHNAYIGRDEITWLTVDYGLSKFGDNREEAKKFYTAYILKLERPEELNELRKGFKDGQVLGDDDFLELVREKYAIQTHKDLSLKVILKAVCQVLDIQEEMILTSNKCRKASFARGVVSTIASKTGKISIEEIAFLMNRNGSTISSLLSRFSTKHAYSSQIQDLIETTKMKAIQIAELQA
jgi:putative transposase